MTLKSIDELALYLSEHGNVLQPASSAEVTNLEFEFDISLPSVYKRFLILMGRGAGNYMRGSSVFFDEIPFLKSWANELMLENDMENIPTNSFVFWMHQGYQVAYFNLNEGDDPAVYYFSEGSTTKNFHKQENTLTGFFNSQLKLSWKYDSIFCIRENF